MLVVSVAIAPVPVVSVLIVAAPDELVSVVTVVESEDVVDSPPPQAANAPRTNTKSNFFIVSWFIVIIKFKY